jgi:integrase
MPGPKTKVALTDRSLKALKPAPAGGRLTVWDAIQPNLAVRVTDKGRRSFVVVRRRAGETSPRWVTLGEFPTLGLADARRAARETLSALVAGDDPAELAEAKRRAKAEAEAKRRAGTFGAVAEGYIRRHVSTLRTRAEVEAIIRRELIPPLGDRPIGEIRRREVIELVERIVDRGGADAGPGHRRRDGGPSAARKALAAVRGLFNWAAERDDALAPPTAGIRTERLLGKARSRSRVLTDPEIRAVWHAAEAIGYPFGSLVQMLLLTAQRRDEVGEARWREVDFGAGTLTLGAARMKEEAANVVPLTATAVSILRRLPRFASGEDFVFRVGPKAYASFSGAKRRLDRKIAEMGGTVEPYSLHDLRRTVRTRLAQLGVLPFVAELVLAHAQPGIQKVYDLHTYDGEKRAALERWEKRLLEIVGPEPEAPPATVVVPLRRRADRPS